MPSIWNLIVAIRRLVELAIMIDTIDKAFYPFHIVSFWLGFTIYRNNLNHTRPCFSIFYIITVWSIYACVFYYIMTLFGPNRIFHGFLMFFAVLINLIVIIISVINNICEHKKIITYIKNLDLINDTLEQLGTPKEYSKMQNSIKWMMIIWFIIVCITWGLQIFWSIITYSNSRSVIIPIVLHYPFYANCFMEVAFMFLLRYIGTRFDKINDSIGQLSETECEFRCTREKSLVTRYYVRNAKNREHVLWTAMHLHLELCRITRNINGLFGIQMTLQTISHFVFLTGIFYFQYHMLLCFKQSHGDIEGMKLIFFIQMNIWCIIFLTKFLAINYICESINSKMEKTKNIIYNLTNLVYFVQIRKDICQFVLQISLRPLNFDGMGLFQFGYKFIRKFIIALISIVICMVQMDNSPLSRILINSLNNVTCISNE